MDTITELMDLLSPWMTPHFFAGILLLVSGALSRWMHLADSASSRRLESALSGLGSRLAIGARLSCGRCPMLATVIVAKNLLARGK